MSETNLINNFYQVFYGGVDMSYENREGGAECASESSLRTRAWEVLLVTSFSYFQFKFAEERCRNVLENIDLNSTWKTFLSSQRIRKYYLDESQLNCTKIESSSRRQIMLLILAMTWGMEIALKLVEGKVVSEGQIQTRHNFLAMKFWQQ
jgi:hypothetical protein